MAMELEELLGFLSSPSPPVKKAAVDIIRGLTGSEDGLQSLYSFSGIAQLAVPSLSCLLGEKKCKQGQSPEDEEAEMNQPGLAILTYKDTHFKEGTGWINDKAKRNYEAMIKKSAHVFLISDGTSPTGNDVEIVHNQLGIRKGYPRGFGHDFVVAGRQRASSSYEETSRKRAEIVEKKNAQLVEEVAKMREEMGEFKQMLLAQQQQPPPWWPPWFQYSQQHQSSAPAPQY